MNLFPQTIDSYSVILKYFSVLSICYEDQQRVVTSAYIDTSKVPLLQQTTCKCNITIFKSIAYFDFSFIDKEVPINMFFDVNGIALNQSKVDNIAVNGSSTLSLTTTQDFKGGAACLYISPGIVILFSKYNSLNLIFVYKYCEQNFRTNDYK